MQENIFFFITLDLLTFTERFPVAELEEEIFVIFCSLSTYSNLLINVVLFMIL